MEAGLRAGRGGDEDADSRFELRIGVGILREISWVRCWILRLVVMVLVEVFMDVAAEPRRMAADTAQTAQIAAES